jgi:hypothetical protein
MLQSQGQTEVLLLPFFGLPTSLTAALVRFTSRLLTEVSFFLSRLLFGGTIDRLLGLDLRPANCDGDENTDKKGLANLSGPLISPKRVHPDQAEAR